MEKFENLKMEKYADLLGIKFSRTAQKWMRKNTFWAEKLSDSFEKSTNYTNYTIGLDAFLSLRV